MVAYDAAVVQQFAERLYRKAAAAVFSSAVLGMLGGAVAGLAGAVGFALITRAPIQQQTAVLAVIGGAALGLLVGISRGLERAFKLKLEAQVALCQVAIERNTGETVVAARHATRRPDQYTEMNLS